MLKRNLFAAPFNKYFEAACANKELPVLALEYRPQEFVYLKNVQNRTIVIFKIMFKDKDDQTLAKVFLQEFSRSTGGAPSVTYSYRNPPTDIEGAKGATESDDHGYVSFVLFQAHISGNKKPSTLSNIQYFRNYLHYHIKCCKAYMHTRMRARVSSLLKILNRAKTEPLVKVKRNIKGKIISKTKN
jgi:actin related protein 2/3 complex, subunit 2